MLIGWIGQMVALLDKPEAVAVQHCVGQIAEFYPQALVYALMISSEDYSFQDSATGHKQREFVARYRAGSPNQSLCLHAQISPIRSKPWLVVNLAMHGIV